MARKLTLVAMSASLAVIAACTPASSSTPRQGPGQAVAASSAGTSSTRALPQGDEPVRLDPANFVARITNPYLPLLPGTTWVYRGTARDGPPNGWWSR